MSHVLTIVSRPEQVRRDVVSVLEEFLADAKAGRLAGIAIAGIKPDLQAITHWSDCEHAAAMIGAVAILQHRLAAEANAQAVPA
jgi:hypothetical protein